MSYYAINTVLANLRTAILAVTLPGPRVNVARDVIGATEATSFTMDSTDLTVGMNVESYDFPSGAVIADIISPGTMATVVVSQGKLSSGTAPVLFYATPSPVPMFAADAVKVFGREDVLAAMAQLYVFEDRACFIVPGAIRHEQKKEGGIVLVTRTLEVGLLMTDRNFGGENLATVGEEGENPGVIRICELVTDGLFGKSLDCAGVALIPDNGDPFTLSDKEREETKREAFVQGFAIPLGTRKLDLNRRQMT
jgi:hypothetical protein